MNFILNWTSFISDRFQIGCRMVHDQYWYVISRIWRYQSVKRMDQYEGTTTRIKNFFTEPSTVVNGLYLGNIYNAADLNTLKNMNITHVVNVSKNISNYFPDKFTYFNIKIDDINSESFHDDLIELVEKMYKLINEENKKIFVHCLMGSSRSATVILLYMIKYLDLELDVAYDKLKEIRPTINVNTTFMNQLREIKL